MGRGNHHVRVCKAQIARGVCSAGRKIECNGYSRQKGGGGVIRDSEGRERFASAGFHLSETSSDVSHLPKRILGEAEGWGWGLVVAAVAVAAAAEEERGQSARLGPASGRDKGDCWRRRSGLFSEGRDDVMTSGSDSSAGYMVELYTPGFQLVRVAKLARAASVTFKVGSLECRELALAKWKLSRARVESKRSRCLFRCAAGSLVPPCQTSQTGGRNIKPRSNASAGG